MAGNRRERIARIIREEASRVVLHELGDPRIGFVTVTKVKVSADLSHARVYVSVYGDDAVRQETMKALSRATKVVQRSCGPRHDELDAQNPDLHDAHLRQRQEQG